MLRFAAFLAVLALLVTAKPVPEADKPKYNEACKNYFPRGTMPVLCQDNKDVDAATLTKMQDYCATHNAEYIKTMPDNCEYNDDDIKTITGWLFDCTKETPENCRKA